MRNFSTVWTDWATSYLYRHSSLKAVQRPHNLYQNFSAIFSGRKNVTYFFAFDRLPASLPIAFHNEIRLRATGCRVSFLTRMEGHSTDWGSAKVSSRLKVWQAIDDDLTSEGNNVYGDISQVNDVDSLAHRRNSLEYLRDAEVRRHRAFFKTKMVMVISGVRGESFDESVKNVLEFVSKLGITATRVSTDLLAHLEYFSPFAMRDVPEEKEFAQNILADENLARFLPFNQGKIGEDGIYFGSDLMTGLPVLAEVKRESVDAENWLVIAETGGGKSFFIKSLILQLLTQPRFIGTIMDVEGFEYIPLAHFVANNSEVEILNMAEGVGNYFDPVPIIETGYEELDADLFALSQNFTLSLFKTLFGEDYSSHEWVKIIIERAVTDVYQSAGVDRHDRNTWKNSQSLSLYSVYDRIKQLNAERGITRNRELAEWNANPEFVRDIVLLLARLDAYFTENGSKAHVFANPVSFDRIKDSKLLICSFGMAGKSAKTVDPVQMQLNQLFSANLAHLRSIFAKAQGKFNFKLWEEFQRWGDFPDAESIISTALTGGRKLGDLNIIISNDARKLLNGDFGVLQNTTSFCIGAIPDASTRAELCERLSIQYLLPQLNNLKVVKDGKQKQDLGGLDAGLEHFYDKAFLVYLKGKVAFSRMRFPDEIARSSLLRTGVNISGDLEEN